MSIRGNILAIESAIGDGSLTLLREGREVAAQYGKASVSRAENLLPNIIALLEENNLDRGDIGMVAVSCGPGSYTGVRIGIATAMGLRDSLGVPCVGISMLEALAKTAKTAKTEGTAKIHDQQEIAEESAMLVSAVPISRNDAAWQIFHKIDEQWLADTAPKAGSHDDLKAFLGGTKNCIAILDDLLFSALQDNDAVHNIKLINAGPNLSRFIGLAACKGFGSEKLEPLYTRNPAKLAAPF